MTDSLSFIFYVITIIIILIIGYSPPKSRNHSHGGIDGTSLKPYSITTEPEPPNTVSKKDVNSLIKNYAEYGIHFTPQQKSHMLTLPDVQTVIDYIQTIIHD